MPESTSISKGSRPKDSQRAARAAALWVASCALLLSLSPREVRAAEGASSGGPEKSKILQPEEDDFSNTPFTEYGEFNEEADEEADAKFFAHGRFFGVSLGLGFEGVTGNRGLLYQGGFPMVNGKLHYWFDFNFAIDMDFYFASHFYETSDTNGGHVDVSMLHVGLDVKYYFDTKNLSAAISFANPYILAGFGAYSQTKSTFQQSTTEKPDTSIGMGLGAGLEFALVPKKCYLEIEGRYHIVTFQDTYSQAFQTSNSAPDLTGGFYTFSTSILFTW